MGKTTVVIDDRLLESAIEAMGAKNKRQVIEEGLRELVRRRNMEALSKELGTFDIDLNLGELERLRERG